MQKRRLCAWVVVLGVLFVPSMASAVQIHGVTEGLYVHQIAHLIFSTALIFLLCKFDRHQPGAREGWRFLKWSLFFFLLWNIDTFIVHFLALKLPDDALMKEGPLWVHQLRGPMTMERWIFYIGRFDHLFCLPAIWFLARSLREFCQEAHQKMDQSNRSVT